MIDGEAYRRDGYVLLRGFLDREPVILVRDEAKQVFIAQMLRLGIVASADLTERDFERGMYDLFETDLQTFTNTGKQAQHLISLHRLSLDERIVSVLRELGLEFPNISTRPLLYFNSQHLAKKEVYWRLSTHQDWRSMQGSLDSTIVWVPLARTDRSVGALEVIPGSHRWGLLDSTFEDGYGRTTRQFDDASFVSVEVDVGDALFFSSFLVHRSGTNVTDSIRWSCHFRYNNLAEQTFVERGFPHPYIYRPTEALLTDGFPSQSQVDEAFGEDR